ncbi:MAG: MFS transporter [Candidatus Lokiarchaeota archaeon]|nr:MFS transporter [Candidatus Lokiarchaeota archaeon]MBD3340283.1 MFS transporter [Candidatus Lokiarchaeota archaeon]
MSNSEKFKYSSKTHWSYGLGGFFTNFMYAAMTVRIIFFYENILLLDIVLIGIAFVIFGFWNAINDPLVGYFSDKKYRFTEKWGRRFPWFVVSAFPCCILYLLVFTVPFQSTWGMFFWLILTISAFELTYSMWNTNYIALFPDKFRSDKERTKVAGVNTITGQFGIALGILIPPLLITSDDLNSYIFAAFIIMVISLFNVALMIPGMKEDEDLIRIELKLVEEEKASFLQSLKNGLKQKNLVAYLYVYLAHQVLTVMLLASFPFWTVYIVDTDNPTGVETILAATFLIGGLLSVPLWVKIGRKAGNRRGFMYGMLATSIFFIPLLFVSNILLTLIAIALLGISIGAIWTLMYPGFSDVIDENILLTNKRQEGMYNGVRMFVGRLGFVIQAISFVIVHQMTNYQPGAATQPAEALWGIRVLMALIPMLFYFSGFIVMWKFYDLTPDKVVANKNLLKERGL